MPGASTYTSQLANGSQARSIMRHVRTVRMPTANGWISTQTVLTVSEGSVCGGERKLAHTPVCFNLWMLTNKLMSFAVSLMPAHKSMAKKIQVSTVRQEANVEVIFLNASLISKVIRAQNILRHVFEGHIEFRKDEEARKAKAIEDGEEYEKQWWGGFSCIEESACQIEDNVLDLLDEIVDAMLDEEDKQ